MFVFFVLLFVALFGVSLGCVPLRGSCKKNEDCCIGNNTCSHTRTSCFQGFCIGNWCEGSSVACVEDCDCCSGKCVHTNRTKTNGTKGYCSIPTKDVAHCASQCKRGACSKICGHNQTCGSGCLNNGDCSSHCVDHFSSARQPKGQNNKMKQRCSEVTTIQQHMNTKQNTMMENTKQNNTKQNTMMDATQTSQRDPFKILAKTATFLDEDEPCGGSKCPQSYVCCGNGIACCQPGWICNNFGHQTIFCCPNLHCFNMKTGNCDFDMRCNSHVIGSCTGCICAAE